MDTKTVTLTECKSLYLDLLKKSLTCTLYDGLGGNVYRGRHPRKKLVRFLVRSLAPKGAAVVLPANIKDRQVGNDYPFMAPTMIGMERLNNLQKCIEEVIRNKIAGDLIETGVWRGGATILMRAVLKVNDENDRKVWVADSFEGLPKPNVDKYPADKGDIHYTINDYLAVSLESVKTNFERYGLLDDQVKFIKGYFKNTLPTAPIKQLAIARLDGDMYESTIDALTSLYPKVSIGGFVIIDDYGSIRGSERAVHDYREKHGIRDEIKPIKGVGVYWKKAR
jgi:O-methyltransferase